MSPSLANHIEEHKRGQYQATMDANLAKSMKQAEPFRAGGRPYLAPIEDYKMDLEMKKIESESSYD